MNHPSVLTPDVTERQNVSPERGGAGLVDDHTGAARDADAAEHELVAEDLLVEEVSIDGMCGVY